jgi:hypothetical protein
MKSHSIVICVLLGLVAACLIGAGAPLTKCARCGCLAPCKKCCRLVCEEKNVEVVCWGCKCEDICVPGRGCPTGEHCKCVCQDCDKDARPSGVCSEPKAFPWKEWLPVCPPQMYTKTKLMKRVEIVKVPTYKWVVEEVCCNCAASGDTGDLTKPDTNDALPPPTTK